MIDLAFVESLIKALDDSSLDTLELERGGTRLRLSKSPPVGTSAGPAQGALPAAPAPAVSVPPVGTDSVSSTIGAPSPTDEEESRSRLL